MSNVKNPTTENAAKKATGCVERCSCGCPNNACRCAENRCQCGCEPTAAKR